MDITIKSKTFTPENLNKELKNPVGVSKGIIKGRKIVVGADQFYFNDILNGVQKEVFNKKVNPTQDDCDSLHEIMDRLDSIKNTGHKESGIKQKIYNATRRWFPNRGREAKIKAIRDKLKKDFPSSQQREDQIKEQEDQKKAARENRIAEKQKDIDTFLKKKNDYSDLLRDLRSMPETTEKEIKDKAQKVRQCVFDSSHKVQGLIDIHALDPAKYDEYSEIISKSVEDLSKMVESLSVEVRKEYLDKIADFPMQQICEAGVLLKLQSADYNPSNIRPEIFGLIYKCFLSETVQKRTLKLLALDQFKTVAEDYRDHKEDKDFKTDGSIINPLTGKVCEPRFFLHKLFLISQTMTPEERTEQFGELKFKASGVTWGSLHIGDLYVPLRSPPSENLY